VIYGLGGSGKSQLALNFLRTYQRDYAAMFWIEAGQKKEHPHTLTSMNNLATVLSRQGKYEQAEVMHRQAIRLKAVEELWSSTVHKVQRPTSQPFPNAT
jgi:nitrogenase subunit NifH